MFTTDDFLGAEVAYRRERLLADLQDVRRRRGLPRRTWRRRDDRQA